MVIELVAIVAFSLAGGWLISQIVESYLEPRRIIDQQARIDELERELEIGVWAERAEAQRAHELRVGKARAMLDRRIEEDWRHRSVAGCDCASCKRKREAMAIAIQRLNDAS